VIPDACVEAGEILPGCYYVGGCNGSDADRPVDCAAALLYCGAKVGADGQVSGYTDCDLALQTATDLCWKHCTSEDPTADPDGGRKPPDTREPGDYLHCPGDACIDGKYGGLIVISTFPCTVCESIDTHTLASDSLCGIKSDDPGMICDF
jgi:hypothetical protein